MNDEALYADPALVRFYDIENPWAADSDACLRLAEGAESVLDLGCGTGMIAAELARRGKRVTGVDPAGAMLAVARARCDTAEWITGDARRLRLGQRFDLVMMTGHAFQVFLTDADRRAVLRTIAAHLAPGGRFVLDSRNPAARAWRAWTPDRSARTFEAPGIGRVEAWNDVAWDAGADVATYSTCYRLPGGRVLSAQARIGFVPRDRLAALIAEAGLTLRSFRGDWSGADWTPEAPEIIALGTAALVPPLAGG